MNINFGYVVCSIWLTWIQFHVLVLIHFGCCVVTGSFSVVKCLLWINCNYLKFSFLAPFFFDVEYNMIYDINIKHFEKRSLLYLGWWLMYLYLNYNVCEWDHEMQKHGWIFSWFNYVTSLNKWCFINYDILWNSILFFLALVHCLCSR